MISIFYFKLLFPDDATFSSLKYQQKYQSTLLQTGQPHKIQFIANIK